jgi:hypothetical protein
MNPFILTEAIFPTSPTGVIIPPAPYSLKRCYSISFLQGFLINPTSQGVKFKIIKVNNPSGVSFRRNANEYDGTAPKKNEFVITRGVIDNLFAGFTSIDFYIVTDPVGTISLIIERSTDKCGDNGDGGDGYKVKLP